MTFARDTSFFVRVSLVIVIRIFEACVSSALTLANEVITCPRPKAIPRLSSLNLRRTELRDVLPDDTGGAPEQLGSLSANRHPPWTTSQQTNTSHTARNVRTVLGMRSA